MRVWDDGKQMVKGDKFDYFGESGKTTEELQKEGYIVWTPPHPKGEFLGEGDTGTFLSLLDNGLEGGVRKTVATRPSTRRPAAPTLLRSVALLRRAQPLGAARTPVRVSRPGSSVR